MMADPLVLAALVALVVVSGWSRAPERPAVSHAQEILDQRLAAGEVTRDEHARRSAVLTQTRVGSRRPAGVLLATLVAALVVEKASS